MQFLSPLLAIKFHSIFKLRKAEIESPEVLRRILQQMTSSCRQLVQRVIRDDSDTLYGNDSKDHIPLALISFDEAHVLMTPPKISTPTRQRTPYHNLGTVLAALDTEPVYFAFLSTTSHVGRLAPPAIVHPSARVIRGSYLIPPFTELPFNIFMDDALKVAMGKDDGLRLSHLQKIEAMVGFGRPLYVYYS